MDWVKTDALVKTYCKRFFGWEACDHWLANFVLVCVSAIMVAVSMRAMIGALLLIVPLDSWAGNFLLRAWIVEDGLFFTAAFVSTFGGATSLLRELRGDQQKFSLVHAIGHMFSAQFAGLMTLIGCLYMNVPSLLALMACGMAGWAGNAWLVRLDKWTSNRIFPTHAPSSPEDDDQSR